MRQRKGRTQKDVAVHLGVDRTTYVKYETGASAPNNEMLVQLASYFGVTTDYLLGQSDDPTPRQVKPKRKGIKIPVLGRVQAGVPVEAVEHTLDYEEITPELAATGEFFALQVRGTSMEPKFSDGDVVIVRKQQTAETGDIVIALTDGDDATIKRIKRTTEGMILTPTNPAFEPLFFSNFDIKALPIKIIGKVIELRAKF